MNWYNGMCWLFAVCGVFAALTPAYGGSTRAQDSCDCSGGCSPHINIRYSSGGKAEDCPACPAPTQPTCPPSTCPPCATCPPPITTTTTEEPPSTTTPDPGPCPGYEAVTGITTRHYKIIEQFKTGEDSVNALCGGGGEIVQLSDQDELNKVQAWAWTKLGSDHISFWTSGKAYSDLSGGYKWDPSDSTIIDLTAFEWHNSQPTVEVGRCIRMCAVTPNPNHKLDYGDCDAEAHFPICQCTVVGRSVFR